MPLLITKAKPNPSGKDRTSRTFTLPAQLAAEWIDVTNTGYQPISLENIEVNHKAYMADGTTQWRSVLVFTGTLGAQETVRVHSGDKITTSEMHFEDRTGATYHVFTGHDYVWNNDNSDTPSLWDKVKKSWVDQATYAAYPTEGKVLTRVQNQLV